LIWNENEADLGLGLTPENEGLDEKHPRDTEESHYDENFLYRLLTFVEDAEFIGTVAWLTRRLISPFEENHVDEGDENRGSTVGPGFLSSARSKPNPFVKDEDAEVKEEEEEEDDLWNEFTENVDDPSEVNVVPDGEGNAEKHMENPNNN